MFWLLLKSGAVHFHLYILSFSRPWRCKVKHGTVFYSLYHTCGLLRLFLERTLSCRETILYHGVPDLHHRRQFMFSNWELWFCFVTSLWTHLSTLDIVIWGLVTLIVNIFFYSTFWVYNIANGAREYWRLLTRTLATAVIVICLLMLCDLLCV